MVAEPTRDECADSTLTLCRSQTDDRGCIKTGDEQFNAFWGYCLFLLLIVLPLARKSQLLSTSAVQEVHFGSSGLKVATSKYNCCTPLVSAVHHSQCLELLAGNGPAQY